MPVPSRVWDSSTLDSGHTGPGSRLLEPSAASQVPRGFSAGVRKLRTPGAPRRAPFPRPAVF